MKSITFYNSAGEVVHTMSVMSESGNDIINEILRITPAMGLTVKIK